MEHLVNESDIERFIRERGVTQCPRAFLLPTQAQISEKEKAELRLHELGVQLKSHAAVMAQRRSGERGAESRRKLTREFFEGVRPILEEIVESGITLDHDIAAEFNRREIKTFYNKEWTEDTVYNMRQNLKL